MGLKKELQVCVEGSRWRWCQPCPVDDAASVLVRAVPDAKHNQLPLIFTIHPAAAPIARDQEDQHQDQQQQQQNQGNSTSSSSAAAGSESGSTAAAAGRTDNRCTKKRWLLKRVVVRGQVQAANLLQQAVEVRLVPKAEPSSSHVTEMRATVAAASVAASFVFPLRHLHGVKVRLPTNPWSGLIPYGAGAKGARQVLLVRVPQKERDESLNIWCHLWTERVDRHHSRLLVLLSPLYVVRSYLPLPLRLHLRTPGLHLSQYSHVAGRGTDSVLNCPGSVDHTHQLSFQLR